VEPDEPASKFQQRDNANGTVLRLDFDRRLMLQLPE
jgi:hypothetical protein